MTCEMQARSNETNITCFASRSQQVGGVVGSVPLLAVPCSVETIARLLCSTDNSPTSRGSRGLVVCLSRPCRAARADPAGAGVPRGRLRPLCGYAPRAALVQRFRPQLVNAGEKFVLSPVTAYFATL